MEHSKPPGRAEPEQLRDLLCRGLDEIGIEATAAQIGQLVGLAELLARWAAQINLTAHRQPPAIIERLILDAAAMLSVLPDFSSLADLGSGAGFPGLPIAILRPEIQVRLVESREKRHHFQRAAVRQLGVENARPLRGRAEQLVPTPSAAVVAQAVGPWSQVVAWMIPWAERDGLLIVPASDAVPAASPDRRVRDAKVLRYQVPLSGPQRRLWTARSSASSGQG